VRPAELWPIKRIVTDIDEIVRHVRFPGWQHTSAGEREVKKALRKTLLKYQLHQESELFERRTDTSGSTISASAFVKMRPSCSRGRVDRPNPSRLTHRILLATRHPPRALSGHLLFGRYGTTLFVGLINNLRNQVIDSFLLSE
jgi:hypothetical protein